MGAHGDPAHHPVARPVLFDAQVGDHHVEAGQLRQFGVVDLDLSVQHLTDRQHLPGRCTKWRRDTLPVLSVTALGSMDATRRIGMKMLRRVARSTTSPRTRGCWRTMLMLITTSRIRPTDSPSGPNTNIRASRAMYTLLTDPMEVEPRQPPA